MPNLHVIYRREPGPDERWSAYSFPVSVYTGGATLPEARSRFREAAEFGVDGFAEYTLVEHLEQPLAEHAFIRSAVDRRSLDRQDAVALFTASHTVAAQADAFDHTAPRDSSGDAVVVACVATDTVRWVLEQMGEQDALSLCLALPGRMVWWTYLAQQFAEVPTTNPSESLLDAGIDLDATMSDFVRADSLGRRRDSHEQAETVEYRPGLLVAS
jgi:hypothetical protein